MGIHKNKSYPLRIPEELMMKLEHLAELDHRTRNKEIEYILEMYVQHYENQHGSISIKNMNVINNQGSINNINM